MAVKTAFVALAPVGYATVQGLLTRFQDKEITERCDETNTVPPELFHAMVFGFDTSGYTQEEIDACYTAIQNGCRACIDADSFVNQYLLSVIEIPLRQENHAINNAACDIARYYLYDTTLTEFVLRRYEDAVRFLESIASGKIKLDIPLDSESAKSRVFMTSETEIMNERWF